MKPGFLLSSSPQVSKLSANHVVVDEELGKRKYRIEDFEIERNIGCGNFSQIWHVTLKARPHESYALKIINVQKVKSNNLVTFVQQERNAMLSLGSPGHPNVIKLFDTFKDKSNVYLLYEYAKEGELWEKVKNIGVPDRYAARVLVRQLLNGLEYIHDHGLIHRDLKCENVVIKDGNLKIIDFGTSAFVNSMGDDERGVMDATESIVGTQRSAPVVGHSPSELCSISRRKREFKHHVGTPNFMPPEAISNVCSGYAADLWALGCTMYQMLLGFNCFIGSSSYFVYKNVKRKQLAFPEGFDADAKDLIEQFLADDPQKRITLEKARQHKFFAGIDGQALNTPMLNMFGTIDNSLRNACLKAQDAIFELTVKRERANDADYREIESAIRLVELYNTPTLSNAIIFNYHRTKVQLEAEIAEAQHYMQNVKSNENEGQ
uniref:non-specific serine/threonine protein kinase n=1 Tax=Amblyomma aureolatum TaxID=187763 RepID=A0A1E1XH30_9ACAR